MLSNLSIENIAIIEKADIKFDVGLNVMTGETGAGKSIVIDSINAVLGERTSKELIRTGEKSASVSAFFVNISSDAVEELKKMDIKDEGDGTLLIQRKISVDGKNSCKINGYPVTVSMLKQIGKYLISIHGQHDSQFLLNSENHISILDSIADNRSLIEEYRIYYKQYVSFKKKLKAFYAEQEEMEKNRDLLSFQIDELENADINVGEMQTLQDNILKIRNAEKIARSIDTCVKYIDGDNDEGGIILNLKTVASLLSEILNVMPEIDEEINNINEVSFSLEDVLASLQQKLSSIDFDPNELERDEERLDFLLKLKRKYSQSEQGMLDFLEDAKIKLKELDSFQTSIDDLTQLLNESAEKMLDYAEKISLSRKKAGKVFCEKVKEELSFLDMPNVKFVIRQEDKPLSIMGKDNIELLLSANEGETEKSLSKTASGGELSRIMLAIRNITNLRDKVETMIFDEIDSGVSGKTAEKIGIKLSEVSSDAQVICVTHSAQIAAKANRHLLIEKSVSNGHTYTSVRVLTDKERKYELARIIGGVVITQGQINVAEEMLKGKNDGTKKD